MKTVVWEWWMTHKVNYWDEGRIGLPVEVDGKEVYVELTVRDLENVKKGGIWEDEDICMRVEFATGITVLFKYHDIRCLTDGYNMIWASIYKQRMGELESYENFGC